MSISTPSPTGLPQPLEPVLPPLAGFGLSDEKNTVAIVAGTAVTTVLALIIVCIRLWIRTVKVKSVGGDDYFIVAALVSFTRGKRKGYHHLLMNALVFVNSRLWHHHPRSKIWRRQ